MGYFPEGLNVFPNHTILYLYTGYNYFIMGFWFNTSLIGFLLILLPYFLSLEHDKLVSWFGKKSRLIGDALGMTSGWGFFGFWIGLWVSPQSRFQLGYQLYSLSGYTFSVVNIMISLILLVPAFWFGFKGVSELGLKVTETHRPTKIVKTGVYEIVRHPQYLGGILGHFGLSLFFGSRDALLVSPIVLAVIYLISWKEEKELVREFGRAYCQYQKEVSMLIPRR
jgi:protein-S-isoprenylcysteine O-methyltransferase Ste14